MSRSSCTASASRISDALARRIPVVRLVLDRERAVVAGGDEHLDAAVDVDDAGAVQAGHVLARPLDVLQVDVEQSLAELGEGVDGVVAVRRPPAGIDRRAEHVPGVTDEREHLARCCLGVILVAEPHPVCPEDGLGARSVVAQDVAHPAEQVDAEGVGQAAGGFQLVGGAAEVARRG